MSITSVTRAEIRDFSAELAKIFNVKLSNYDKYEELYDESGKRAEKSQ